LSVVADVIRGKGTQTHWRGGTMNKESRHSWLGKWKCIWRYHI